MIATFQKIRRISAYFLVCLLLSSKGFAGDKIISKADLADQILQDKRLDQVETRALSLLNGFSAGSSYREIWIRDFNTFINGSLRVHRPAEVRDMLLLFFKIQGQDGNVPDGAVKSDQANVGYQYR
jgi:hypothetical protein